MKGFSWWYYCCCWLFLIAASSTTSTPTSVVAERQLQQDLCTQDDSSATFPVYSGQIQNCHWLNQKPKRVEKYCNDNNAIARNIQSICCNTCMSPTSITTPEPATSGISAVKSCVDASGCAWIANSLAEQTKWCSASSKKAIKTQLKCCSTCAKYWKSLQSSEMPSVQPSMMASASPTVEPSRVQTLSPSMIPTITGSPTMKVTSSPSSAPWSFLVVADWHWAEGYVANPLSPVYDIQLPKLEKIHDIVGGDLVLMPGDLVSGTRWMDADYKKSSFGDGSISNEESIEKATSNAYSTVRRLFHEVGYTNMLVTIGDHELGGNNGWGKSSHIDELQNFRKGFAKEFNANGGSLETDFVFHEKIGDAPSSPVGTPFEFTSFAYQHRNVLFITLDVYLALNTKLIDYENGLGGEGFVTASVVDSHLQWLEFVLSEAKKLDSVHHIIVQGHVPILQPVRKVSSSGGFLDYAENSPLWKLFEEYEVDLYLAGEVHATTAECAASKLGPVQISSRGNTFNSFLKIEVSDEAIYITHYAEDGIYHDVVNEYLPNGSLVIDKSGSTPKPHQSDGILNFIEKINEPLIHFDFEEKGSLQDHKIQGLKTDDDAVGQYEVYKFFVDGVECTELMMNKGSLDRQYDAITSDVGIVPGRNGSQAGQFVGSSIFTIESMGPFGAGTIISMAMWINTNDAANMILVHSSVPNVPKSKHMFLLSITNGRLVLDVGGPGTGKTVLQSKSTLNLSDGGWHHVAVSMPRESCLLSEIQFFVDGKRVETSNPIKDTNLFFHTAMKTSLGSFGQMTNFKDAYPDLHPFEGLVDEFFMFNIPLTEASLTDLL